jgi:uncharacterized protein
MCGNAAAQPTTHALGQCKITVDVDFGPGDLLMSGSDYTTAYFYYLPALFDKIKLPPHSLGGMEDASIAFIYFCTAGLSPKTLNAMGLTLQINEVWDAVNGNPSALNPQEKEIRRIDISGSNWKGVLMVGGYSSSFDVMERHPPLSVYSFCIKERGGYHQMICGNGGIFVLYKDIELKKVINVLKTIRFDSSFVPISPGFDCKGTVSVAEAMICASYDLSRLDKILSTNYKKLKSASTGEDAEKLAADQRAWLKQRDSCIIPNSSIKPSIDLALKPCLLKSYTERIKELCKKYSDTDGGQSLCVTASDAIKAASSEHE